MVNLDMLGGLRSALERGDSLEKAMKTLFNSGYKKEEIEEAARGLADFKPEKQIQPIVKAVSKIKEIIPPSPSNVPAVPAKAKSIQELKSALEREHSLKKAMLVLFNSGYKVDEIIKSAKDLLEFGSYTAATAPLKSPLTQVKFVAQQRTATAPQEIQKVSAAPPKEINIPTVIRIPGQIPMPPTMVSQQQQQQAPIIKSTVEIQRPGQILRAGQIQSSGQIQNPVQKGLAPEKQKREKIKGRTIIIVLASLLIFLIGLEAGIFIFKQQFINILNSIFG